MISRQCVWLPDCIPSQLATFYVLPTEALAKVNLKELVAWNRWRRNDRGISDGCQSSGFKCVPITTRVMLCNSGARQGGFSAAGVCAHVSKPEARGRGHAPAAHTCAGARPVVPRIPWPAARAQTWSASGPPPPSPSAGKRRKTPPVGFNPRQGREAIAGDFQMAFHCTVCLAAASLRRFKSACFLLTLFHPLFDQ